ncbi:hypothetical protein IAU68_03845 [Corynebacterium lujinxingii]|uniref:Uncharacterized protein n=1 Tax=Corynebacterium lujinxingii TaxID=2763010 RepID=A0A7H0K0U1_9CORY|nr:hypothetical protein [Corynebacterium lujinxingii]QNP89430.1 hypothetical protein IAU68_06890 [Corynebacterium lujinxingii]QNP90907.1 hypothetical protein IAU68_03845 [Corynebacterium lujinxingii]
MTTPNIDVDLFMPFAIEWEKRDVSSVLYRTDKNTAWTQIAEGFAYQIVLQNWVDQNVWLYTNNGAGSSGRTMATSDSGGAAVPSGERRTFTVVARPGQETWIHVGTLSTTIGTAGGTAVARVIPMPIIGT